MSRKVAIIIVNWNSFAVSADCIRSLQELTDKEHDVIVVDNGSEDRSGVELKANFDHIILIQSPTNRGFTGGNNLGMEYAIENGYEYVFLLNNDTSVKPDLLSVLVDFMDSHPEAGGVQPMIYFHLERSLLWNGGSYYNTWLGHTYVKGYHQPLSPGNNQLKKVDWLTGCAFFTRVSILKEVGLLAENLFIYYEDVDLSFRIRRLGYPLYYHPGSCVYHIAGMSNKSKVKTREGFINPEVHFISIRNRIWLLKEYTRPVQALTVSLFTFFYILAVMAYFVARLRFVKFRKVLAGVRAGLKGRIIYQYDDTQHSKGTIL
jgi:GT2 family glycosyltransferase